MPTAQISSYYLHWLHDYLRREGQDSQAILGVLPDLESRPYLPMTEWRQGLVVAATWLDDPDFGLHFGQTITPARFGLLGYLLHHCDTLGQAGRRMRHYLPLFFSLQRMRFEVTQDEVRVAWQADVVFPHYHEEVFAVVSVVQFARALTGQHVQLAAVGFASPAPNDSRALRDFLGCPIVFSQESTWMQGPLAALALPTALPDALLRGLLEQQAEAMLASLAGKDEFMVALRQSLFALMQEGEPTLERAAARLHLSARTLHRRLEERGSRFREVLEQTRQQLAESYLPDVRLSIADVALLLGYSEQSPFTHAFKRWTGKTPYAWRKQLSA